MTKWRKSTRCETSACVEVATLPNGDVAVRNSKVPGGMPLVFTSEEWSAFTAGVRAGEFDLS